MFVILTINSFKLCFFKYFKQSTITTTIMDQFRNRKEFAAKLGIDARTLRRKLAVANIALPKGILSPQDQQMIRKALGFDE
jgi:hypothetical protein